MDETEDYIEIPKKKEKYRYNEQNIRMIECSCCHNDTMLSRIMRVRSRIYCDRCSLKKVEDSVKEWSIDFRRHMNGDKDNWKGRIMSAPKLSDYIRG